MLLTSAHQQHDSAPGLPGREFGSWYATASGREQHCRRRVSIPRRRHHIHSTLALTAAGAGLPHPVPAPPSP